MKLAVGVKVIWPAVSDTVPPVGLDTAVTVGVPSTSVSLALRSVAGKLSGVSSLVDLVSSTATGASLTAVTVTDTVAVSVSPAGSVTV